LIVFFVLTVDLFLVFAGIAVHGIGREVATPEMQRWDPKFVNEDLIIDHAMIAPKSDGVVWRCAVAARPVKGVLCIV
jgi:hypothetical protein